MVWSKVWMLRGLLVAVGLLWTLPVWVSSVPNTLCGPLETLRQQLSSTFRRRYLKHNFPINYTIQVHYEEVFKLHNISRLRNENEPAEDKDLQELWLMVAKTGIKRILWVLPERHPTRRRYLADLEGLFRNFEQSYVEMNPQEERVLPDSIQDIWDRLNDPDYQGWRSVKPKSLLDNCYRTLLCLFKDCFVEDKDPYDYCNRLHWRREKIQTPQPT